MFCQLWLVPYHTAPTHIIIHTVVPSGKNTATKSIIDWRIPSPFVGISYTLLQILGEDC